MRRCVLLCEKGQILVEAHAGFAGGHYGGRATARKVLHAGLWWPTLHNYVMDYAQNCDICQRTGKPSWRDEMPLVPQVTLQPFDKWAMEFMGLVNPPGKRFGTWYIITSIDYLTRWAEAASVMDCTAVTTMRFLFDNIVTWFGCPRILMSDQGIHFMNRTVSTLTK